MNNLAVGTDNIEKLTWSYNQLYGIFNSYCFQLQQFKTNYVDLLNTIDKDCEEQTEAEINLLCILWDRLRDKLYTKPLHLDTNANNKRKILSSIASQFDIFNYNGPLLNRSILFLQELQNNRSLGWDDPLSEEQVKNWRNISRQVNSLSPISFDRCVGSRKDRYQLCAFADSSKFIYGVVIYIINLNAN